MAKNISKTLIVGLGGTGQKVIVDIKKRLLRTYGEIPTLVKFLEFDTDDLDGGGAPYTYYYNGQSYTDFRYRINLNEFLRIPSPGVEVIKKDKVCSEKLDIDQLQKVAARLQGHGAGGYRVLGRAHFLNASEKIIAILTDTVTSLKSANIDAAQQARGYVTEDGGISVYVIASLAGGTGSSAFMDLSRMLQIAGVNVQFNVNEAGMDKIFGVFFLPKFFEGKPHTDNIRINAYTALSELDYTFDLADPTKHAPGSIEVQDDRQDYTGHTNNNKRVIYDGVFLIDSLTSKGHTHTITEATNYVASFIAGSIAADSGALTSSYVNSNHKMNTVDGKFQNYSGMGYCELSFRRQDLVNYLLNRKMIGFIEQFKQGDSTTTASQIAEAFINENKLNEGVMHDSQGEDTRAQLNDLTDSIINMTDGRLTRINMASVDTGKDAAANIETSKARYLTSIGTTAQEMVQAFARPKEELFKNLREMLDDRKAGKGFSTFPDLARCLKTMLNDMKSGLEDEINQHATAFERIENELRSTKTVIAENVPGRLFSGNKRDAQEAAIRGYCNKIRFDVGSIQNPTLAWLKVETARKTEAIAIYEEMISIVESYYKEEAIETVNGIQINMTGSYLAVDGLFKVLTDQFLRAINSYRPAKAAVNETIFADAYFKEYFESHEADTMALDDQSKNALDEYIGGLFADLPTVDDNLLAEMRQKLLGYLPADGLVRKVQEERMSIDDLFISCFGKYGDIANNRDLVNNPQLQLLNQVNTLFETLWCYLNFRGQGLEPTGNMVVGVFNRQNNIFNDENGYAATISGWSHYEYISLGDPDRIAFMLMDTAIPAFKLMNVDSWANEYDQKKQFTYTFSDKRLEGIDMIKPGVNEDAEIAWAYGWLFGLINNSKKKRGLRVKPSYAYASSKGVALESNGEYNYFETVKHSGDIFDCHQKFINDQDLSQDILNQAMDLLGADPLGNVIKIKEWVNDGKMWDSSVRGKERSSMSPAEIKVIQNEVNFLELRFVRLAGYGLALDSTGKVTHTYSEALEQKEKEMKAKSNPSNTPEA